VWKYFEARLAVQYVPTLRNGYISTVAMVKRSFAAPHHVGSYQSTIENPALNNKPIRGRLRRHLTYFNLPWYCTALGTIGLHGYQKRGVYPVEVEWSGLVLIGYKLL
jgi:hypothetical protein